MSSEQKPGGSRSSFPFTSQLFGTNDPSSNDIFAPIFSSSSFKQSEVGGTKTQAFSSYPKSEGNSKYKEGKNDSTRSSREMSSIYEEQQTTTQPCHFSSSIYYGGQDVYNTKSTPEESGSNSSLKKHDDEEDHSGCASRGNWWQGSLYY